MTDGKFTYKDTKGIPLDGTLWKCNTPSSKYYGKGPFVAYRRDKHCLINGKEKCMETVIEMNYYENKEGEGYVPTEAEIEEDMFGNNTITTALFKLKFDLQNHSPSVYDMSNLYIPWIWQL